MQKYVYYYKVITLKNWLGEETVGRAFKLQSYEPMTVGSTYFSGGKAIKVLKLVEVWDLHNCAAPIYLS